MGVDGEIGTVCILLVVAVLSGVGTEKLLPPISNGADDEFGGALFFSPPVASSNEECDCDSVAAVGIGETFFDMESGATQAKKIWVVCARALLQCCDDDGKLYLFYKVRYRAPYCTRANSRILFVVFLLFSI